jgi:hypothetical protein
VNFGETNKVENLEQAAAAAAQAVANSASRGEISRRALNPAGSKIGQ